MSAEREALRAAVIRAWADPVRAAEWIGVADRAQRQARGILAFCPLHDDGSRRALSLILGEDGTLQVRCHAGCVSGDVFSLVAGLEGLNVKSDFGRVLDRAAALAGIPLPVANAGSPLAAESMTPPPSTPPPSTDYPPPPPISPSSLDALWQSLPPLGPDAWEYVSRRCGEPATQYARSTTPSTPGPLGRYAAAGMVVAAALRGTAGQVVGIQVRSLERDKSFRVEGSSSSGVFGDPHHLHAASTVIVAEGLTDYLATAGAYDGMPDVCVLGVAGVKATGLLPSLPLAGKQVILALDADPAGDQAAATLVRALVDGGARCFRARPHLGKDVCDLVAAGVDLRTFFQAAKPLRASTRPNVIESSIAEDLAGEEVERYAECLRRLSFGVKYLDVSLNGIRAGDLIIVGARTGIGKTDLVTSIALVNALCGHRVALFALEAERREIGRRLKYRWLSQKVFAARAGSQRMNYMDWRDGELRDLTGPFEEEAEHVLSERLRTLTPWYRNGGFSVDDFLEIAEDVHGDFDVLVLDHLHFLELDGVNENRAMKEALQRISDFAVRTGKPIVLAAHLRKSDRRVKTLLPSIEDFHGSSDVPKIATKAVMLAPAVDRTSPLPYLAPTYMSAVKCRRDGARTRHVGLVNYDWRTCSYVEDFQIGVEKKGGEAIELLKIDDWPAWAHRDWLEEIRKGVRLY